MRLLTGLILLMGVSPLVADESVLPWSFRPLVRPAVPQADGKDEMDRYVRAELADRGLQPNPAAAREVWLRRVTLDLHGLLPTAEEMERFVRYPGTETQQDGPLQLARRTDG